MSDFLQDYLPLIAIIVFTVLGFVVGRSRRRPVLGTVLGFLFSVIGVIVVAVIPRKR